MAAKKNSSKNKTTRGMRAQQIIFLVICVIIILAMVLSLAAKF